MAVSTNDIKSAYPLPVYNYKVNIGTVSIGFSEVSGLRISTETTTYKESPTSSDAIGPKVMHMRAQAGAANVTLKKGVVAATSVETFYDWISSGKINQIEKKDISIQLCDEAGKAVITWKVINAFPTKLDAPSFDANSNEVAVETMELMGDSITVTKE
jgi:phage tail-like protein